MRTIKNVLLMTLLCVLAASCGAKKGTNVGGKISDGANLSVYFDKLELQANEVLSKVDADGSGRFNFSFPEGLEMGLYRVRAGAKTAHLVIKGNEKDVNINGSLDDFGKDSYTVEGSPLSSKYAETLSQYRAKKISMEQVKANIDNEDPLLALMVGLRAQPTTPENGANHAAIAKKVVAAYPNYKLGKEYAQLASGLEVQYKRTLATQKIRVGEMAPDIEMEDPYGKVRKLSDLRGKVVLLDFWASWCGPCRRDNPKVVKTYDKYKEKGFDVFSVSLDGLDRRVKARIKDPAQLEQNQKRSKDRWIAAIQKDQLKWKNHVSDLQKWESAAAAQYGVRSIPQTFLVGRDGKIAAINPRNNLEQTLLKFL